MFGDFCQAHLVRGASSEAPAHVIVMHWWPWASTHAAVLFVEHRSDAVGRAGPPRGLPSRHLNSITSLIGEKPVPVFGVISVGV